MIKTPISTLIVACLSFVALGMITAVLGPAIPQLAANSNSTIETLGTVFTGLFVGALLAQIFSGRLNDQLGPRLVLLGGLVLLAAGMVGIAASAALPITLISALIAGLGHGALDISGNVLIAQVWSHRSVTALNILGFAFGAGAVISPALAGLAIRQWSAPLPALWWSILALVICIPLVILFSLAPKHPDGPPSAAAERSVFGSPWLWIAGLWLLVYVGIENGVAGWTSRFLQDTTAMPADNAALVVSGYWLALTIGRMVSAVLGTRLTATRLLGIAMLGMIVAGLLSVATVGNQSLSIAAVLLLGFCYAPMHPATISMVTTRFKQAPGRAASIATAMASIGGATIPALHGWLLGQVSPHAATWLIAGCSALILMLFGMGLRIDNRAKMRVRVNAVKGLYDDGF